jgi:hypothetical protein
VVLAARRRIFIAETGNGGRAMAKAYYSTVFEQRANDVWNMIRDFNSQSILVRDEGQSEIDDGKSGDTVGAV